MLQIKVTIKYGRHGGKCVIILDLACTCRAAVRAPRYPFRGSRSRVKVERKFLLR
jgi:hypothetical protein